jgi:glycosyltransferase involved in cell wall biosynthesis
MDRISICVCTYNRPLGLRALLESMDRQRFLRLIDEQIHVIVIDNSPNGSVAASRDFSALRGRFSVSVVHEPSRGLSVARNRALAASRQAGASHVAFIDDDELPHPAWLEALHAALADKRAAAAIGPVVPIFESQPQSWLPLVAYADARGPRQGFVDDGYTCNMICALSAIDANGLRFDERFNLTGGEDTFFFKQLRERGLRVAWAEQAIVYSVIPRHRMSAGWLWRRWYRTGDIEAHLGNHLPSTPAGRLINLTRGMARILVGSVRIVGAAVFKAWHRPDAVVASFYTACRGLGLVANVLGHRYKEYGRRSYR